MPAPDLRLPPGLMLAGSVVRERVADGETIRLFRSDDVEVRLVPAGDGGARVITFDAYHEQSGFDRPAFGEGFFLEHGVTAVHVLTAGNAWYQYREMPAAVAAAREGLAGATRILAYGSSMGGYGALRFGPAMGADAVLALSPQYSIDPRRAPFETRWLEEQRRILFLKDCEHAMLGGAQAVVAYDPTIGDDRAHVALIAREIAIEQLRLPYGGHPVGPFLNEMGLLQPLVLGLLHGSLDLAGIAREARLRRGRSASWLGEIADRQPVHRTALGVALAERAVAVEPTHAVANHRLAVRLRHAGRHDDAIAAHRRTIALDPMPSLKWEYAHTLLEAGDLAGALAVTRELQAASPSVAGYHRLAARIQLASGDANGASLDLREAIRLAPLNWRYRWALVKAEARALLGGRARPPPG